MAYVKYEIYNAIVYFEEKNEYKARPILIYEIDNEYAMCDIFTITSQNKQYTYDYEIKEWQKAGLLKPSYIKLADMKVIDNNFIKTKLGVLQPIDIDGMEKVLRQLLNDKKRALEKYNETASNKIEIPNEVIEELNKNKE